MDLRLFSGLLLSAAGSLLPAQQPEAGSGAPTPAASQDPDRPQKPVAERITELTGEKERLAREIAFVRERVKVSKQLLIAKLSVRKLEFRSIDAGTNVVAPAAAVPTQRQARVMAPEEAAKFGADVLMIVNGRTVRQGDLDSMMSYLATFKSSGDEAVRLQRAMLELVRIEATLGSFPEAIVEAELDTAEARRKLGEGTAFGEVVRQHSRGPNLKDDGKVKITRNCPFGLQVEMAAFATTEGQLSTPVRGYTGFVLLQVDKVLPGSNPDGEPNTDLDAVEARMILIPYHPDPSEVDQARNRAVMGPVDIAVRDASVLEKLPALYRPLPMPKEDKEQQDSDAKKGDGQQGTDEQPRRVGRQG